jgi:hypothetical protein
MAMQFSVPRVANDAGRHSAEWAQCNQGALATARLARDGYWSWTHQATGHQLVLDDMRDLLRLDVQVCRREVVPTPRADELAASARGHDDESAVTHDPPFCL